MRHLMARTTARAAAVSLLASAALLAAPAAHAAGTVTNGGFEADAKGTATPTGWSTSGASAASYTESGGHSGSYRLTHWSASAYKVTTFQTLTGLANGSYTLTAWVRSSGGQNTDTVGLIGCGGSDRQTSVPPTADGNWVRIVVSTTVSNGQCTIGLYSDANAGNWTNYDDISLASGYASLPIRGGDVSSLERGQEKGGVYYDSSGTQQTALTVLGNAGMNYARLRVWVNPADGFDDETELLAMARQVKAKGMGLLLDLHYSDTWADPGHQTVPAAWAGDSLSQLETQVTAYSRQVVGDLVAQGTAPDMVQVGNEINAGMLWSLGSTSNWGQFAALLKAGISGVKAAAPNTKIMLHIADGAADATAKAWYQNAVNEGVPFDVIGLSYYDYWHGPLDQLQTTLDDLAATFRKPVVVAETAYPWTMANGDSETNSVTSSNTTLDAGYAATPAGQAANFRDVQSVVQAVPNGMGWGAFYWEPTWTVVAGNGWDPTNASSGDGWENQAMFDFSDKALPVVNDYAAR
ncbi:arabinogalactan endo-1,4-beta-galactosidase [Streptacidiphilus pinicola]|uniref:Arabinogalactan endo-beta-1,4-galactanase n=1 Tax=Streptacidiphilus pinicola TaxID=2219663 RepID=A0A2X0IQ15_9ACTN|nr:glycosyl hydrolase 53 family protein [Streptacidiphilus pinicola]RAG87284.1 arabinogalactan endo-1,4-beta-galactosidase [Streptacidiphilus pinicola]